MPRHTVLVPLAILVAALALPLLPALAPEAAAAAEGRWRAATVEGRRGAAAVTLVGRDGVSANRVAIYCDRFGAIAASFARRPGLPAEVPLSLTLFTDAGDTLIAGRTNRYGVLVVSGAAATEAARLLAAAQRRAGASVSEGGFGEITVLGSTNAIGRVQARCGPVH